MVPAKLIPRALAFVMDLALVLGACAYLLIAQILPEHHPEGLDAIQRLNQEYLEAVEAAEKEGSQMPPIPDFTKNETVLAVFARINFICLIGIWAYFSIAPLIFRGGTLGQRTFSLRIVATSDEAMPGALTLWFRAALIALSVIIGPWLWVNFFVPLFNDQRRSGHDWFSKTKVVTDTPKIK